jgi:V8-like Glu-specific endopeptidase
MGTWHVAFKAGRIAVGSILLAIVGSTAPGCGPAEPWTPPPDLHVHGMGIVGGSETSAWPAVGAYLIDGGHGGMCTATLVSPEVLLTAAHCADLSGPGDLFYVGSNALDATADDVYEIDQAIVHPGYNWHGSPYHDVAVLLLHEPITDIEPIPVNTESMSPAWVGDWLHYVGFGVDDHYNGNNSGIKRETDIQLYDVGSHEYVHWTVGTNVCSGDSGGPSLVDHDGEWHVAGINSFVGATEHGEDACHGVGVEMRVDADLDFFDAYFDPYPSGDDDDTADDDDAADDDTADDDVADDDTADDDAADDDDTADDDVWVDPGDGEVSLTSGCECSGAASSTTPSLALLLLAACSVVGRRSI